MIVYIPVFIHKFIPGMDTSLGSYDIQNSQHLAVMCIYEECSMREFRSQVSAS